MTAAPRLSAVVKRSLVVRGHSTSISLEDAFWLGLKQAAADQNTSVAALVATIDQTRGAANLSSAIRVFVLQQAQAGRTLARPGTPDAAGIEHAA